MRRKTSPPPGRNQVKACAYHPNGYLWYAVVERIGMVEGVGSGVGHFLHLIAPESQTTVVLTCPLPGTEGTYSLKPDDMVWNKLFGI